jgi:hypothetical protein
MGWLLRSLGVRKYLLSRSRRTGSVSFSRTSSFSQQLADSQIQKQEFERSYRCPGGGSMGFNIGSFEFYSVRMDARNRTSIGLTWFLPDNLLYTVYQMSRAIMTDASSNEAMAEIKQHTSFNKDLEILESPEFEVSVESKIATAARMRASYRCLAPLS